MKTERMLTAAIFLILLIGAVVLQSGFLRLGPAASAVIRLSANLKVPPLDDPAMVRRGAAHYDLVCARCHASPLAPDQADQLHLTPPAPKLHLRVANWLPEILFLTVKHGIPNTAMPAWPTQHRDDEVWSMVAFLRVLPGLDPASYRALAGLDATRGPEPMAVCGRCHGVTGRGEANGAFPRLDIQTADYLRHSLTAYRDGQRQSGFMAGIAADLSDADIAAAAASFATLPAQALLAQALPEMSLPAAPPPDAPAIATDGIPARNVPACKTCHGPADVARPEFPRLAGQYPGYLATQLRLFAENPFTRGGGPFVGLMEKAGHGLIEPEIAEIARWYGNLTNLPDD